MCNSGKTTSEKETPNPSQCRASLLRSELESAIDHYRGLAKRTYRLNAGVMILTVGASLVGGIGGLSDILAAKAAGALALLPGLLAVFATTMKFQAKANQHYRRKDALQILRNRLLFELPEPPADTDIAAISREWADLTNRMNDEYERSLQFDWAHFTTDTQDRTRPKARLL